MEFICKALKVMLISCLTQGIFQYEYKKANIISINECNDKQCVNNY